MHCLRARLRRAGLSRARLSRAGLSRARLRRAGLSRARLNHAVPPWVGNSAWVAPRATGSRRLPAAFAGVDR
ncbi:MAG: pentapeptide repeat-containing protein [Phycisphaerales bacterium]|nr:pentapeptide repeat-containing protein [Phycisphaerales bacterium]